MDKLHIFSRFLIGITFWAIFGMAALAQSTDPAWLEDLEFELATKHECEVSEYVTIHEGKVGGRDFYTAKVKCVDGRTFDASRIDPRKEFHIRLCEIITC